MPEISPDGLMAQLEESVARLAAPQAEQRLWVETNDYPIEELILDFDLAWPLWQMRLSEAGAIDAESKAALDQLRDYAMSLVSPTHEAIFTWDGVQNAPEWRHVRSLARNALKALLRPEIQAVRPPRHNPPEHR